MNIHLTYLVDKYGNLIIAHEWRLDAARVDFEGEYIIIFEMLMTNVRIQIVDDHDEVALEIFKIHNPTYIFSSFDFLLLLYIINE